MDGVYAVSRLLDYQARLIKSLMFRASNDRQSEDRLIESMTEIWYAMSPSEQEAVDDFTERVASRFLEMDGRVKVSPAELARVAAVLEHRYHLSHMISSHAVVYQTASVVPGSVVGAMLAERGSAVRPHYTYTNVDHYAECA